MKKIFLGVYHPSVLLTYLGLSISLYGVFYSKSLAFSLMLLILAGLCDTFDGMVANSFQRNDLEKAFGVQIDSLSDLISFGVFPVQIYLQYFAKFGVVSFLISVLYLLSVVTRLAYFNASGGEKKDYFTGLAVTYASFFIPLYGLFSIYFSIEKILPGELLYVLLAFFFVFNFRMKKPSLKIRIGLLLLAVLFVILLVRKL